MDVRLINPFIRATEEVFRLMIGCEAVPQPPKVLPSLPHGPRMINAIIGMEGGVQGAVVVRLPMSVALRIGAAFTGTAVTVDGAQDAVGELANMITGNAKRELGRHLVRITVPRIAIGDEEIGDVAEISPWLFVPFQASLGNFVLAVSFTMRDSSPSGRAGLDSVEAWSEDSCVDGAHAIQ